MIQQCLLTWKFRNCYKVHSQLQNVILKTEWFYWFRISINLPKKLKIISLCSFAGFIGNMFRKQVKNIHLSFSLIFAKQILSVTIKVRIWPEELPYFFWQMSQFNLMKRAVRMNLYVHANNLNLFYSNRMFSVYFDERSNRVHCDFSNVFANIQSRRRDWWWNLDLCCHTLSEDIPHVCKLALLICFETATKQHNDVITSSL